MQNFHYHNPAKIVFGKGAEQEIGLLLSDCSVHSLLLIYSGDFVRTLGILDTVKSACEKAKIAFYENGEVVPNPKVELVRQLVAFGKEKAIDFVLAVGGGSAIDTAKSVALGIPYGGDVWDFFDGTAAVAAALPVGVISTLPASGSETSNAAILSNGLYKLGVEDDCIIPQFAIMNPLFTLTLPRYQTACGIADILSHLLERYFTTEPFVDTTDFLIEGAVQALMLNGERVMQHPQDYNARAEVQWLASLAHNNLLDTGRIGDWGSHRIEHELSAQYGIAHGEGMAIVLLAWMRYMAEARPEKLAQLANRVFHLDYHDYTPTEMALQLADRFERFFHTLHLKTTLGEMGITDEHFTEMAARATKKGTATVGHYLPLNAGQFIAILILAL